MSSKIDVYKKLEEFKATVCSALAEIEELDVCCKSLLKLYLTETQSVTVAGVVKIQAIIDYMYEKVNIGNWKEVRSFFRKAITVASYLKLICHIKSLDDLTESAIKECYKIIDFGILFGCPLDVEPMLLQNCAAVLSPLHFQSLTEGSNALNNGPVEISTKTKDNTIPIEVLSCPSLEHFYKNYVLTETPVVLDNCMSLWPALSKWKDQNYFIKLAGLRTVSIELGKDYTDSEWTQKLMTIEEFIRNHIFQNDGPTGYLAQYQLFEQIPELRDDIIEPEYCCFSDSDCPVDVMAWYGPKGTVSPLHHDPKRNLLAQVVGEKQIFLFSPKDSEYLYPHEHELLNNTAKVDPREPDFVKFPKYKDAKVYYTVLQSGQMLYIPPKWWHFVESLAISFSVSFWWE